MFKKSLIIVGTIAAVSLVSACSGPETMLQQNWGKSYETVTYSQTLNPDADQTLKTVDDLNGQAAEDVRTKYQDGFKDKVEQKTVNLKIE